MKPLLLRLHRWVALVFALPLVLVLVTGLILSFEPSLITAAIKPGSLDAAKLEAMLARHDPSGQARGVALKSYDGTLSIGSGRGGGATKIMDLKTGEPAAGAGTLANLMSTSRQMHQRLLIDAGWLVTASTIAMLVLSLIGVLMGWPRFSNTLSGWHKAMSWGLLPLVVLSPLTGLFLAFGVSFTSPPAPSGDRQGPPMKLVEAVRVAGKSHDLSSMIWLRQQGPRMLLRVAEGGEFKVYAVGPQGTTQMPRNWPRLWHEGNFASHLSAAMNVITSIAMIGLLVTGIWIWARRKMRLNARLRAKAA